ncbi:hypothetical protein ACJ8IN_15150, partial [Serratia sp. CY31944]|uniref:hypothetical protein n=1 Tax=Serratia sp. CY31944 TaxID=3383598 RepID=UPI003F9EFD05
AWFNNVESKPGVGYPHAWEDQEKWKGGLSYRTVLGYVCAGIILYSYVVVPVLDYFGIVLFQMPIGEIFKVIALLLSGGF